MTTKLDNKSIAAAQPGDVLYDQTIKGLQLRVFPTRKSFYVYYRTKDGQQRKPKLADWGTVTLDQARKLAKDLLLEVAGGKDPQAERQKLKEEPTVDDMWARYWEEHGQYKKSSRDDKRIYACNVAKRIGHLRVSAVRYVDVYGIHSAMRDTPYQANRTLALISKMFNCAHRWGWRSRADNPASGVERYPERKRRRHMRADEAPRIAEALAKYEASYPQAVLFLYLLILSGARHGEISKARWDQLEGNRLVLSEHKTDSDGEDRVIYLPKQALDLINRLPRTNGTICGVQSPRHVWRKVRTDAGCPDLRIHDLRHTFGTAALRAGYSLSQIGELLGHKSTQTTKIYAELMDDTRVAAAEATADVIQGLFKSSTIT